MTTAELLLHPVRLRVVQALLGGRELTTAGLRTELADVPTATLYRHVGVLVGAGVLVVSRETRVRGAVERTYRLQVERAGVGPEEAATMSPTEHRAAFTAFVAGLLDVFDRYLDGDDVDLGRDLVGYRQVALEATDAELERLLAAVRAAVAQTGAGTTGGPAAGRRRRLLTTVLIPVDP